MIYSIWTYAIICLGFWANPEQVQYPPSEIGAVRNVFVGKLSCAARLNDLTHVQFWCSKNGEIVHNEINKLSTVVAITVGYADTLQQTFPDPVEDIAWVRWIFAYPELNPTTVSYQVGYGIGKNPEKMLSGQF